MWKGYLKTKSITILRMSFIMLLCCCSIILAGSHHVCALDEKPQHSQEEYEAQYDNAIKLADLLRQSPDMLHNKLYTVEQEVELQALVNSVCNGESTDRGRVQSLLACIFNKLEPGDCYELNGWDTLCDGESEQINTSGKTVGKKKAACEEVYCYTFYDVCRLAGIPCFILEDCQPISSKNRYIAMVYIEVASGSGKEWHFVDVAAEQLQLSSRKFVYEDQGTDFYPQNLVLDYDKVLYFRNVISLSRSSTVVYKEAPKLVYDSVSNQVKAYFNDGTLAAGDQFYMTEEHLGTDGVAPSGWIETKDYSSDTVTTYRSYAVCGVFLRGRVEQNGKEYELYSDNFYSLIPCYDHEAVASEAESEEHKAFALAYKKKLEDKALKCAEVLLNDPNYIWNDTYFRNAEDEVLLQEAVDTALDWDYVTANEASQIAFETAGIPFVSWEEQSSATLSAKAKAQAILLYIKRNVEPEGVGGATLVNSAFVLREKKATCAGFCILFRDMCVKAGVPCFRLRCSLGTRLGDTLYGDHGDNLIKVGDEWLFCDPMSAGVIGKGDCFQLCFMEGYDTGNDTEIFLDSDAVRSDQYAKWNIGTRLLKYYEFDSEGKLGIYQRIRYNEPVVDSETDENGRYTMENGLHTVDITEKSEDGSAEIVMQYAYYYQNCRTLEGKKSIDGTEYCFDLSVSGVSAKCHKLGEVSRRYVISKLSFQPLEDQPYDAAGVCPVPEIYHGEKRLEYGKDFRIVEYKHNKEITTYADASYRVEGIGNYTGEATRYFKIVQADISEREVKLSQSSYSWKPDMKYYKPQVDLGLTAQDYSVAYYDYDKIGKAKVVITGKGNYKGSVTKEYDIKPGVWNEEEYTIMDQAGKPLQSQKFNYHFSPIAAEVRVYWQDESGNKYILSEALDYDVSYSGTEHPGTVTVTATAKGNYQGTLTCTYEIMPYFVREDAIRAEYTQTIYNGMVQKPAVTIEGMVEGKDYVISYEKNVNGLYQEMEPKEIGEYRIVVRMSEDMAVMKEGISKEDASNVYYISYSIQSDGSGSGAGGNGSGTGGSGSGTGGSGNGTGGSGSGTGGAENGTSGSGTGGTGNSTGGSNSGTGSGGNGINGSSETLNNKDYVLKKLKLTAKKKAIKISWSKVKKAKGYQIQISQSKNFKKAKTVNVKKSKNSFTFKKLKNKTKYYIRIRAYKGTVGTGKSQKKIYGGWRKASGKTK